MKDLFRQVGWIVVLLALVFLFKGDPNLWDRLHERAMRGAECVGGKP